MSSIAALILPATIFRLDARKLTRADVIVARALHEQLGIPWPFAANKVQAAGKRREIFKRNPAGRGEGRVFLSARISAARLGYKSRGR